MITFVSEQADVLDRAVHAMLDRLAARSALISLFSAMSNEPVAAPATTAMGSPVTLQITSQVAEEGHLHGYDRSTPVASGASAMLTFAANIRGVLGVELEESAVPYTQLEVS